MKTDSRADASGPTGWFIAGWTAGMLAFLGLAVVTGSVVVPALQTQAVLDRAGSGQLGSAGAVRELGGEREALRRLGTYLRMPEWLARRKTDAASLMCSCGPGATEALVRALEGRWDDRWARELVILSMIQRDTIGRNWVVSADGMPIGSRVPEQPSDGWEPLREALRRTEPRAIAPASAVSHSAPP
jgi:hypothetical protein